MAPLWPALIAVACGAPPPSPVVAVAPPPTIETAPPPPPPPPPETRDALEKIREAVGTRMWLLADLQAIRAHEARDELEAIMVWQTPLFTLPELVTAAQRILITARSGERNAPWALAVDHGMPPDALRSMFDALRRRCDDEPLDGVLHSVRCGRTRPYLVAAPTDDLVIVVRPEHADAITAVVGSGGLPMPRAPIEAHVIDPRETFRGRQMPEIPATIERGYGELRLLEDGGAALLLEGTSATPDQARADADELNRLVDGLDIPGPDLLKGALRRMLRFEAEDRHVRLVQELSSQQVRFFMLFVDAMTLSERPRDTDAVGGP